MSKKIARKHMVNKKLLIVFANMKWKKIKTVTFILLVHCECTKFSKREIERLENELCVRKEGDKGIRNELTTINT